MNVARRRAVVAAGLMFASFAGAAAMRPRLRLSDQLGPMRLEAAFPTSSGVWHVDTSVTMPLISPDQRAVLDRIYNQTISRIYTDGKGRHIMLSVAYGGDQSDATRAHRPEVCYPAQGFQIRAAERTQLMLGDRALPVRRLVAQMHRRIEPITYWVAVGERVAVSGTEQKIAQLHYSLAGVVPDGMLVRVSSIGDGPAEFEMQRDFITSLHAAMTEPQRRRVFGA